MAPPPRRRRSSVSSPTLPSSSNEFSNLTLPEVRARLERNARVLDIPLSPPPSSSFAPLTSAAPLPAVSASISPAPSVGGGRSSGEPPDPVREKLLAVRRQLLAREGELMEAQRALDGVTLGEEGMRGGESSVQGRRGEEAGGRRGMSGKQRAMEVIEQQERRGLMGNVALPISQTLALSSRDAANSTAQLLSTISLDTPRPTPSPTPKSRRKRTYPETPYPQAPQAYDPKDEIARAQAEAKMRAFTSRRPEDADGDWDEEAEADEGPDDWKGGEGDYDGEGDRVVLQPHGGGDGWREKGTGEEVDEFGEDGEGWAEENDEYYDRVRRDDPPGRT